MGTRSSHMRRFASTRSSALSSGFAGFASMAAAVWQCVLVASRWIACAAVVLLAACGGSGNDVELPDGEHTGSISRIDPDSFRIVFEGNDLVVDEDIRVRLLVPCCDPHDVEFEDWLAGFEGDDRTFYGTSKSEYRITIEDGRVV